MKKIIVPIDFSDCAINAVRYAVSVAKIINAEILIIYVHSPEILVGAVPAWQPYVEIMPFPDIVHEQMAAAKKIVKDYSIQVQTFIKEGDLNESISDLAQSKHADLVIMGTEGVNFAYQDLWGTHSSSMVESKKIPIIVVPENYKGSLTKNAEIVFATDFKGTDYIPEFFVEIAENLQANVNVFYDTEPYKERVNIEYESREYDFIKNLFTNAKVTMNHSHRDNLIDAVEEFINSKNASLLVMIAHERGFFENIFHKSVTKQMALHSIIPFLAIPDQKDDINVSSVSNSGFIG